MCYYFRRATRGGRGRTPYSIFWKSKRVHWFQKKRPWLCPSWIKLSNKNLVLGLCRIKNSKNLSLQGFFSCIYWSTVIPRNHSCLENLLLACIFNNYLYSPNFFQIIIFGFLMFFDTLNREQSTYVTDFCCLELFMLLFFITKLTV